MTTSTAPSLQNSTIAQQPRNNYSQYCTLHWRRNQLFVTLPGKLNQPYLPALDNEKLLVECLKISPVNLVIIDPKLGNNNVQFWANACKKAKKSIYIYPSARNQFSQSSHQLLRLTQRVINWWLALILLILFSPMMVGFMILMRLQSPTDIFAYEWHIGETGKLFQTIKFSTSETQKITFVGFLMYKFGLDNLPKLLNVLRGEMSLISSNCWALTDAVHHHLENANQLNQLSVVSD
jgi:lipopolysaccharide/colanic/teichoic acid biosynthesis glycosyltransferase